MTPKQIEEMNQLSITYEKDHGDCLNSRVVKDSPVAECINIHCGCELGTAYEAGYKAAMEKAKVLEDALDWYAQTGDGAYSQAHLYLRAKAALKKYRGDG